MQVVSRQDKLWLSLLFLGIALLVAVLGLTDAGYHLLDDHKLGSSFGIMSVGLGIWLTIIIAFWTRRQGKFNLFELPTWFSLNAYIQVVLNVWLLQPDIAARSPWLITKYGFLATKAIFLIIVALTSMWAGYMWNHRRIAKKPNNDQAISKVKRLWLAYFIWFITWLISFVSVATGIQGYLPGVGGFLGSNYLFFIGLMGDMVTFLLLMNHFIRPSNLSRIWFIFVIASRLMLGLIIGTKGAIFILLFVVMANYFATGKLSRKWLTLGFIALFVVVPVVNVFRGNLFRSDFDRSQGASFNARLPVFVESVEQALSQPLESLIKQTQDTFQLRQGSILEVTAAFLAVHPTHQSYVGLDMAREIVRLSIPRLFWWDKPTSRSDLYMISTRYLGAEQENSFAAPGQFADAYRAGGWIFVFFWFLFLGVLSAWLFQKGPGNGNLAGIALYLTFLTGLLTYDNNVVQTSVSLIQFGILLWIVSRLFIYESRSDPCKSTLMTTSTRGI